MYNKLLLFEFYIFREFCDVYFLFLFLEKGLILIKNINVVFLYILINIV